MGWNVHGKIKPDRQRQKARPEDILELLNMINKKPVMKKKRKIDFSNLFTKPKGQKDMGMGDLGKGKKPFEGLF